MLADLDLALKNPAQLIQQLHAQQPSLDGFEERVATAFTNLFEDVNAREQLPSITSLSTAASLPPAGTLVRFRAMVQDTGLGSELYRAQGSEGQLYMYGAEEEQAGGAEQQQEDYSKLRERQVFYVVSVPGETSWVKEDLDKATVEDLQASVDRLSLDQSSSKSSPVPLDNKYPLPSEPHFGLVAKLYGDVAEQLKTTDVCEFIGVLGETSMSTAFDELSDSAPAPSPVPALHVIVSRPAPKPSQSVELADKTALREELVRYLAASLGGDEDAAEWVLLALVARIHTRHATGLALGSLSLNLALPDAFSSSLASTLSSLVPSLATLELSVASLNDKSTRLAPRSRDESLESGQLQLASGTAVVVDLTKIGEGKLEDTGVRNLRHLATTIAQQKLSYEFPYSSFDLETDLNFILLSEGKAIVPAECIVYVKPASSANPAPEQPTKEKLEAFRSFISTAKHSTFSIPEDMSAVIQADFVERRQSSQGGEGMSQDDLLFRMTAARLMALSHGETALSKEAWVRTAELDDRRKERMPVVPKQGKVHGSLARAGKVKSQTPKVEPQEKKKKVTGRAKKRHLYNSRFVNVTVQPGGKVQRNKQPAGKSG
ncbi:hypothetical protein JCM6882_000317 [Rhodosporidiobolus microsporus]